ncbi:glycerophosphodiester phosphodiesterase [Maribacter sp. 2304DJ31-5]|uniref:glycerophosphodiester phosphodiesterase n=1 Tax=Maribacter sp. 2304DJ31-5 TaxID=3386273 RepID=UPI0039BC26DE
MKDIYLLSFITLLAITSCTMIDKDPLVVGHRGAMGHETENTLASVQKALDLGVDMIEIDVFKIKSGEIVVFHDKIVDRLTNSDGKIEAYTISELKQLTLDGGHKIPVLQDVLKLIDNKIALNIELKGANTSGPVNLIMDNYIREHHWPRQNFMISSFDWNELEIMRTLNPEVDIAVLTEENPINAIPVAKKLNAVAINPNFRTLNADVVSRIKKENLKIYTWTVNEPDDIQQMRKLGVDGIITNYPERVR